MEIIGPIQTSREDPTQHTLLFGETKRRPPMANIGGSILGGGPRHNMCWCSHMASESKVPLLPDTVLVSEPPMHSSAAAKSAHRGQPPPVAISPRL